LLDLPGILDYRLLKRGNILRLINTVPGPEDDPLAAAEVLFRLLPASADHPLACDGWQPGVGFREFLAEHTARRHFLVRGGHPDFRRGAADLLKRFQDGALGTWTLETPTCPLALPEDLNP
jgi:ribosome biogenesis GTPase A